MSFLPTENFKTANRRLVVVVSIKIRPNYMITIMMMMLLLLLLRRWMHFWNAVQFVGFVSKKIHSNCNAILFILFNSIKSGKTYLLLPHKQKRACRKKSDRIDKRAATQMTQKYKLFKYIHKLKRTVVCFVNHSLLRIHVRVCVWVCVPISSHQFATVAFVVIPETHAIKGNKSSCVFRCHFFKRNTYHHRSKVLGSNSIRMEKIYTRHTHTHTLTPSCR